MKTIKISSFFIILLMALFGCSINSTDNLTISITDAPAIDNFQEVFIDFDRIEVSRAGTENKEGGWITINKDGGTVDLLKLTNGALQELGVAALEPGQYNQIRFYISRAWVKIGGVEHDVHLASNTIKLVKPFFVSHDSRTELIVDFNAAHSIKKTKKRYVMTPVTRIVQAKTTGAIKGKVVYPTGVKITASTIKSGETDVYSSTICDEDGKFLLAYLEPGTYDVVLAAEGYSLTVENIKVTRGDTVNLGEISLIPKATVNSIEVNVQYNDASLDGKTVYVTSFIAGGKLPDDEIETKSGTMSGDNALITLDNNGAGYENGTYGVRAHIDVTNDGVLTEGAGNDFIAIGEVSVSSAPASVTLNGPWGTFFSFAVFNSSPPNGTEGKSLYITVVSHGDYWGNYSYGENAATLPSGVISVNAWGPDGWYDLYACIDMNDNMAVTGAPDSGDYVASILDIEMTGGSFPYQTISSWSVY